MANEEHLAILRQGVEVWNEWRKLNQIDKPDLRKAKLQKAKLQKADLRNADLWNADLNNADLSYADLSGAILSHANLRNGIFRGAILIRACLSEAVVRHIDLSGTILSKADLSGIDLRGVDLRQVDLREAGLKGVDLSGIDLSGKDLSDVDFSGSNLSRMLLIETNLSNATLTGCNIYGISIWDANLDNAIQKDLVITPPGHPPITVDNIEIAQFIYMLIYNEKVRHAIDTITSKAVLILGRFTEDRKPVLDALRENLRQRNYIPILFDFEKPESRDLTETIVTLAHLSRFIIADLTDAKSLPQELQAIVPNLLSVAVQPVILKEQRPYAMFEHIQRYQSVLPIHEYESQETLLAELVDKIIIPAEAKVNQLRPKTLD